ncbi:MAG: PilC/PilY family type IV pilus protein, partial [Methylococcales bacterium]
DSKIFIKNTSFGLQFGTSRGGNEKGSMNVKVRVCNKNRALESNCVAYDNGDYFKPEGLIQKNADHMRFGVTSYTNTSGNGVNGGVLRSNMKYLGTLMPNGSGGTTANSYAEILSNGTLVINPNPGDATDSGVSKSGVIPYINKFSDAGYKSNDPAGELFYESIRYFKNLGPTLEYVKQSNGTSWDKGGFPILDANHWQDPITHYCQKNFIIGINDANPWMDKKLPGTFFMNSTFKGQNITEDYGQPSNPDDAIDVTKLTNKVGDMQGITGTSQCIGCTSNNCDMAATNKVIPHLGEVFGTCPGPGKYNSYYIAGLAYYANIFDIRPTGTNELPGKQTISTFMIDTQEYNSSPLTGQMNMLWLAGKYGGFNDANDNGKPDNKNADYISEWDLDDNGEPDNYVLATNPEKLITALTQAFSKIDAQSSSASAVAANTSRLDTGTLIYQAKFDSSNWSGELLALDVDLDTGYVNVENPNWKASAKLPAFSARNIYSYNPAKAVGLRGIDFQWTYLSKDSDVVAPTISQQTYLNTLNAAADSKGSLRLNWLRGDNSKEQKNDGTFRNRLNYLGDIINSDPVYVWKEDYGYGKWSGTEGTKYNEFRTSVDYLARPPMLYLGANDGMLHGFDARKNDADNTLGGTEKFAYVPNALFPQLSKLTDPSYAHQYFVDGMTGVGDVYADLDNNGATEWHTLLAGTTGAGGRGVFGLDVTYPQTFGSGNVLWEFTGASTETSTTDPDLGYTLAQPIVARMNNGSWAVIIANGYKSDNGKAVLFILDAKTGVVIKKIDTSAFDATPAIAPATTTPATNGLSTPVAVDNDNDLITDTIYAGDLHGNLWKFDVSSKTSTDNWKVVSDKPLFVACSTTGTTCSNANRQPITGKPSVGKIGSDQTGGVMVYFGTGKYFESGDNIVGDNPQIQTFYGLWDHGVITDRANLQEQTITYEGLATNNIGETSTDVIRVLSK